MNKRIKDAGFVEELANLCKQRWLTQDDLDRDIVITPFGGDYKDVAGFVIILEGTPSRCVIIYECIPTFPVVHIRWLYEDRLKLCHHYTAHIQGERIRVIQRFLAKEGFNCE